MCGILTELTNRYIINPAYRMEESMRRMTYRLRKLPPSERALLQEVLFDELERQVWYSIIFISMWGAEIPIPIQ